MLSRRHFLKTMFAGGFGFLSLGGYAFGIEPRFRLAVDAIDLKLRRWPSGAKPLKAALIADLHASDPWMPLERIEAIVEATNALRPDIVLLLGDYMSSLKWQRRPLLPAEWAPPFARLEAPLGTHAILGNHDYWWAGGPEPVTAALRAANVTVLLNDAVRIERDGHLFWLSGTESTMVRRSGAHGFSGRDDLTGTLAKIPDDGVPIVHLAHEPALFGRMPDRVALTLSGHTHGGQISLPFVGPPLAALRPEITWIRGHYRVDGRDLVVSSGLGCTFVPMRFMVPPEITLVSIESIENA